MWLGALGRTSGTGVVGAQAARRIPQGRIGAPVMFTSRTGPGVPFALARNSVCGFRAIKPPGRAS